MSNGNGHRWSKFWWCDWQNDAALRMCSLGAQGYWMRALCLMHEAEPVGHLTVNGRIPTTRQMAAITGATEKEVVLYTNELETNGVFSRLDDGTIYCRRMVRDAAATEEGKKWGRKGGNPNLTPREGGLTPPINGGAKPNPLMEGDKLESEAESEADPPVAPPAGGRTTRRRNGIQPRDERIVSGGIALMIERVEQLEAEQRRPTPDDDLTDPSSYLRIVAGGRG